MCGFAGEMRFDGQPADLAAVERMSERMQRRGPDGCGAWQRGPVALAHRRLTIIDLSRAGEQPMTDKAISWIGQQKALTPEKPFFAYFAPGATHAPHHVPKEWADKYKGQFDDGWDKLRERTFARQKELGVIPADCKLTARHEEIPAWGAMPEALKPVLRRQMEVYAGFLEYTDYHGVSGEVIGTKIVK